MKKYAMIVLLAVVLAACGGKPATPAATVTPTRLPVPEHTLLGSQGNMRFVLVGKTLANDRPALKKIADRLCEDLMQCVIYFWDDPSQAGARSPLTDEQVKAQIANYNYNMVLGKDNLLICAVDGC